MNPDVPTKLEEVIHKALEKDRNLRYQHASDIRTDLQRLKRDTESGKTVASGTAVPRWSRRTILISAIALASVVVLIAVGAFYFGSSTRTRIARMIRELQSLGYRVEQFSIRRRSGVKDFRPCGEYGQQPGGSVLRLLPRLAHQRHEASNGSPHLGTKDCSDHSNPVEEGSTFRRGTIETASSLSVSDQESVPSLGDHPWRWQSGFF